MTDKQVAELRAWCNSSSYDPPDADAIKAALDEREALLVALKSRGACTSNACLKTYLALCEVVAKVET